MVSRNTVSKKLRPNLTNRQTASLSTEMCLFTEKATFFKKAQKIKISKFRGERIKTISEKKSSTKFLYPLGESMFKKSAKLEMVNGRLVDSYKKPLYKETFFSKTKILHMLTSAVESLHNC
jgi:CRISPR/Cas system endoribonuclease Cas6 (RAMP superfamily)